MKERMDAKFCLFVVHVHEEAVVVVGGSGVKTVTCLFQGGKWMEVGWSKVIG